MSALGYPPHSATQADGEHFLEQGRLAVNRLKSGAGSGFFDGLYLIGNAPVVLCELKRYDALDSPADFERAKRQLTDYAKSGDFEEPPPFLVLYSGKPERTRFFVRKTVSEPGLFDEREYEELEEIWEWRRVKEFQLRGSFALEVVDRDRLRQILLYHLDRIEDDLRPQVNQAIQVIKDEQSLAATSGFGKWLRERPEALARMRVLHDRKVAEIGKETESKVAGEMVTQAALNYLNKVFFLSLCEDRHLPGFYRIMREFLPRARAETAPATAAVFLGLLRRRIRDTAQTWDPEDERAYRALRQELAPEIRAHVIEQNSWRELIQVAFDLAAEHFPLVYREDAYDYFRPSKDVLAELIYDLSTKSFEQLTNRHVGDIYQSLLSARRTQQAKLGAFYTPRGDVDYMVSRLELTADSVVLDPCMGSGHFLEGLYEELLKLHVERGADRAHGYRRIVEQQLYGGDIDSFALSLAAIRLFLLADPPEEVRPRLYAHDMLLHSPERPGQIFTEAERVVADEELDELREIDTIEFDAVVGNPPYGARKPEFKKKVYRRLYGEEGTGTGDADTYAMFFANGIERLKEGGRLCLITNDSFRTLTTHAALRRHILDRCKIVEILLTDTKHFEGVSFQFAGMAITTLEKCSDEEARRSNVMRLIDYVRDPKDYAAAVAEEWRQEDYEALPETPFFVGVPREVFEAAKTSGRIADVAKGRVGVQTGEDARFTAPIEDQRVQSVGLAKAISPEEQRRGIPINKPYWVPLAKGEGFGEYWRPPSVAIDWSEPSVAELERRAALPAGTARKTYFRNREHFFRPGLTYSVISSGRISIRLLPAGCVWTDKGSAILVESDRANELFLLGYLNSALATYFMKKLINSTATAHAGYIEKLPYRRPPPELEGAVVERVERIVAALRADPAANIQALREEVDDLVFDLFEIRASRDEVRRFYRTVGLVQAASE